MILTLAVCVVLATIFAFRDRPWGAWGTVVVLAWTIGRTLLDWLAEVTAGDVLTINFIGLLLWAAVGIVIAGGIGPGIRKALSARLAAVRGRLARDSRP